MILYLINMKYIVFLVLFVALGSCQKEDTYIYESQQDIESESFRITRTTDEIEEVSVYIFRDSVLQSAHKALAVAEDGTVSLEERCIPMGRVVILNGKGDGITAKPKETTLEAFFAQPISYGYDASGARIVYVAETSFNRIANSSMPISLNRITSRIDVDVESSTGLTVTGLELTKVATSFAIGGENGIDVNKKDVEIATTIVNKRVGQHYLYAHKYDSPVNVDITLQTAEGNSESRTVALPTVIEPNKVYTLSIGESEQTVKCEDWGYNINDDNNTYPTDIIRVDKEETDALPYGVSIAEDGLTVLTPYTATSFTIQLDSKDPVEAYGTERCEVVEVGENKFQVTTARSKIGEIVPMQEKIYLRRKNLTTAYDEFITVEQAVNPIIATGPMVESVDANSDFIHNTYIDGELLEITVPEGWTYELEGHWLRFNSAQLQEGRYVLEGGYKPNDPEADGRVQNGVLTLISEDGVRDVYQISRRNYGLPVQFSNGFYWTKFNLRGDSESFDDQIQIGDSIAQIEDLMAYVRSEECTMEQYLEIVGGGYKGSNPHALIYNPEMPNYDNWAEVSGPMINQQAATKSCPPGYRRPTINEFLTIYMTDVMRLTLSNNSASGAYNTTASGSFGSYRYNVQASAKLFERYAAFQATPTTNTSSKIFFGGTGVQESEDGYSASTMFFAVSLEGSTYDQEMMLKLHDSGSQFISAYGGFTTNSVYHIRCVKTPVDFIIED